MGALTRAAGIQNYHGYFIPELWVPKMQLQFEKRCVVQAISQNQYEGVIKNQGDTVNINLEPTVAVNDYVIGQKLNYESLEPNQVVLEINQAKYFAVEVDDIDQKQSNTDLIDGFAESAGRRMKEKIDYTVLQGIYNSEDSNNSGATAGADSSGFNLGTSGSPVSLTDTNILDYFSDVATVLDEQSCPSDNRWFVIPPAFANLIMRSDVRDASFTGEKETIVYNGKLPKKINGFDVYVSRQLKTASDSGTCWYCLAGHISALTFASQLVNTEVMRGPDVFGTYIRGLHVFGYKVVRSEGLAVLYAKRG